MFDAVVTTMQQLTLPDLIVLQKIAELPSAVIPAAGWRGRALLGSSNESPLAKAGMTVYDRLQRFKCHNNRGTRVILRLLVGRFIRRGRAETVGVGGELSRADSLLVIHPQTDDST